LPILVANAPCSWGVLEFDAHAAPFGYPAVLDQIAGTGYVGTELGDWGFMPTDPAALREAIDARALALVGAFVPVELSEPGALESGIDAAVRTAALLRDAGYPEAFVVLADRTEGNTARIQVAGRARAADGLLAAQWDVLSAGAAAIATAVRESTGLRTVFHPHCASFVETADEIDALMSRTDPALLGLCLDTGHLLYAGAQPEAIFDRYGDRIWHVHFKDCDARIADAAHRERVDYFTAVRRGLFCELGRGAVDFAAIVAAMRGANYDGWIVVEQDVLPSLGTPEASARRNRTYLRTLGL
jgi:inosose dehydratase